MNKIATLALLACTLLCTPALAQQKGTFTDVRDGKTYKTVKIGEQVWMAENLNYEAEGSKCFYYNKPANCDIYGRLYDWTTAMKACPNGWHLPNNAEWDILLHYADGTKRSSSPYESKTAGKFLKATSGWNSYEGKSGNGEDKFGFSALPGGIVHPNDEFKDVGSIGFWWSANVKDSEIAEYRSMDYGDEYVCYYHCYKFLLLSVRCLQNTTRPLK